MKKLFLLTILVSSIAPAQSPVHFESTFIFLEYLVTSDTLILGYDTFATDGLDPELGEAIAPPVPGYFGVRLQLPADTSIYTKKDFRFGCGRPDYLEYLIDIESGYIVEVNWDWLMIYSVTFIDPYNGQILETINSGSPAQYYIYSMDKIIIGVNYDGPLSWPTFQILSPNGGEILISGEDFLITWINSFLPPQNLWYSSDTGINWFLITDSIQYPDNSFLWEVPQLNSDNCLVRVGYFPCAYDVSNNFFSITYPVNVENESDLPTEFSISQNYPNPFNSSTTIAYGLPAATYVSLIIYDCLGNNVRTLINEVQEAGTHYVVFESNNLSSGIYFMRIRASNWDETKRIIILK